MQHWATRIPYWKTWDEIRFYRRVGSSCSTSDIRRVHLATNAVISHEWEKDRKVLATLEIKEATDAYRSASYLDIGSEGRLRTKLYDKRYYLNFPIVNFPFICSNIPAAPVYGVYISQLIRYSRGCDSYQDFLGKGLLLTRKLLNQGFLLVKLKSSLYIC
jgi:hypothetical protein